MNAINKVHVIFKTHLDIGFTDLASNVIEQYFQSFIPKALELSEELEQEQGVRFVWTTGSWLIHEYLKAATPEQRKRLEAGIASDRITWHGLPFTTHTELMDPALFDYGLSIAQQLNEKYGKKTIAAKMTDVPGHTLGLVPHMAKAGICYLHLGVNPASKQPSVPNLFIWKGTDGSEIVVNYAGSYGNMTLVEGFDEVMVFAHTGDNCGPPTAADIRQLFKQLAVQFPGAVVQASTMDAFAEKLLAHKELFPIVTEEIGDSWIHGAASDPLKIARYRELLRLRDKWVSDGRLDTRSREYADFCDQLILIPEHTWGMDEKTHLSDFKHYSVQDFHAARQADTVTMEAIPDKYRYIGGFSLEDSAAAAELFEALGTKSYSLFESSWEEQRNYISKAISALSADKQEEANHALGRLNPDTAFSSNGDELALYKQYRLGCFMVQFAHDGSIIELVDQQGRVWADGKHRLGVFEYETLGTEHYHNWFRDYVVNWKQHYHWADADFGKPGMEFAQPRPEHLQFSPSVIQAVKRSEDHFDEVNLQLRMSSTATQTHGAPQELHIRYRFYNEAKTIEVELNWFQKQAYRLPEASWFSFAIKVDNPNLWTMDKLGTAISPLHVVENGNRNMHAVNTGVYYDGTEGSVRLETLDAPVLCPGEKRMLRFDQTFAPLAGGIHFNLHNNVWGTNFPMWFEEDMKFRFVLSILDH
ncbi:DUF5054 domain-containing protein [Paenibacillus albus]|uniref:DUF5054 domain-containing protein n=1 Tax=Paenibacillus albus TaxID=2495582 RepID=A0A3Q8XAL3_9BACL|nr:DUF5054 domain-containing protein [Paenibacillus albus]AZN43147.1 DUF5054 domain-containing protein [Paenibacillus albus]